MKRLLLLALVALDVAAQPGSDLIPVKQAGEWIYINSKGQKTIPQKFKNASYFSQGLAAVRIGGRFGYIDTNGTLKIPAIYDSGSEFEDGLASVVRDGNAMIINRDGKVLFDPGDDDQFGYAGYQLLIVRHKKRTGLYTINGGTVLKPIYSGIRYLSDSLFIVYQRARKTNKSSLFHLSRGFLLPFGFYDDFHVNTDKTISYKSGKENKTFLVTDRTGNTIMRVEDEDNMYPGDEYAQGYVILNHYGDDNDYESYLDASGNTLFGAKELERAHPFSEGRAFVKFKNRDWQLIDLKGRLVSDSSFSYVNEKFEKVGEKSAPVCLVRKGGDWGVIDTSGKLLVPAIYNSLEIADADRGFFLASRHKRDLMGNEKTSEKIFNLSGHNGDDSLKNMQTNIQKIEKEKDLEDLLSYKGPQELFGLVDLNGKEIMPFRYHELYPIRTDDVYYFETDSSAGLFKTGLGIIYDFNSQPKQPGLDTLDLDYMERGYCYAASAFDIHTNLGGHGSSSNDPKIGVSQFPQSYKGLFLWVDTLTADTFYNNYAGHSLFLVNRSGDTVVFDAQDGRLYITMQALREGKWTDIEYSPSSWCGNSYHEVGLKDGQYWKFTAPVYKGSIPVNLRFQLLVQRKWSKGKKKYIGSDTIYSNTFAGSINPAQFWKKKGHTPTGIMDPYNE